MNRTIIRFLGLSALLFCNCLFPAMAAKIGIAMPNLVVPRWQTDGGYLKKALEQSGHTVDLVFADNTVETQINNLKQMIGNGCQLLVVVPVDGKSLTEVLQQAKNKNIKVISYDRLIMDSDAVNYYATFDNYKVGVLQGAFIEEHLQLENDSTSPKNIELFTGSIDDNNVNFIWSGAMFVLEPYLKSGKLICLSAQTKKEQVETHRWLSEVAENRMTKLIGELNYGPDEGQTPLHAVLAPNDTVANGIMTALTKAAHFKKDNFPIITGQDCTKPAVKSIKKGYQSMCVFKDSRILADHVATMADAIFEKTEVPVNDTTTYNNGTGFIPTFLCSPTVVTNENLHELLIDSGYYSPKDLR